MAAIEQVQAAELARVSADASADSGGVDPDLLGEFLPALAAAVGTGRRLARAQVQRCRVSGERAAREGVTLSAVLDLYLSAAWRLWRQLPAVEGATDAPLAVVTAGEVMLRAVDDAAAALAEGYQAARRGLVREQESARREFIDDLLSGPGDVAALLHSAAEFGLDLSGPHAVAVVAADKPFVDRAPLMGVVERAVHATAPDVGSLVASKQSRLVVVFAAPDAAAEDRVVRALTAVLAPPSTADPRVDLRRRAEVGAWRMGIGRSRPGAAGVRASFEDARTALDLAVRLELPNPVVHAADLLVYQVLLRDRAAITDLVRAVLGPLQEARGGAEPLLDTLAAYYDVGGNAAEAARAMHLSVRAMTYRLQRVRQLTGHDPARSSQRFALHAAVLGAKLLNWPAVPLDE
ncbi:MAG TPA: helix-turn-helix domain-containing protein [Streptomyces sp.]